MEEIQSYLADNPLLAGAFIMLIGAVRRWRWLYGSPSRTTDSLQKLDGWANVFGRKAARVVGGIVGALTIAAGILYILASCFEK